jgi:pimeloyl-ACP methyl ester carboxylesterase
VLALGIRRDRPAAEVEARRATPPSQFITVDGLRIHYRDRGQGPVVVLLHGSNSHLLTWEAWTARLAKDHRVVALDLPGHGLTGPDAKARYSAADMAAVVDLFVDKLGLSRFTIAGNSMGGNVAWHYTLAHPAKVERLVLVDAAGLPRDEGLPFVSRAQSAPLVGRLATVLTPRFMLAGSVRKMYGDPSRVEEARIDEYYDLFLREGNRDATRLRRALPPVDSEWQRLGEIHAPTLILWGSRDIWILPKYGERFHQAIKGSSLVVLDGLGHLPMEEDPDSSLAPVSAFLAKPI